MTAQRPALDANRWHFNHGPIDIVAEAYGDPYAVCAAAHDAAWARFVHVLDELVRELPLLRLPASDNMRPRGVVAGRMWNACAAFSPMFITPMAAVAGFVAQELIAFYDRPGIERALDQQRRRHRAAPRAGPVGARGRVCRPGALRLAQAC